MQPRCFVPKTLLKLQVLSTYKISRNKLIQTTINRIRGAGEEGEAKVKAIRVSSLTVNLTPFSPPGSQLKVSWLSREENTPPPKWFLKYQYQAHMAVTAPKYIETMLIFSPETVGGLVPQISTSRVLSLSSVFSVTTNGP